MSFSKADYQDQKVSSNFGELLRYWRKQRGKSQLDLSLDTGVSQRHISFIESGRSIPSRDMVLDLTDALDVPLRERNALLHAAGFAPIYVVDEWEANDMRPVIKALEQMLKQHEPHPAVVMDRYWNILMTNEGAPAFFNRFIDLSAREGPKNILHLMFDPAGMKPFVRNWEEVVSALLQRVRQETVGRVIDEETKLLLKDLRKYPEVDAIARKNYTPGQLPIIPVQFAKDGAMFSYFSMVTTVGTPQCITAQELRVETMFPAD